MVCQGGDNLDRAAALPGSCAIIERFEFDTRIRPISSMQILGTVGS